MLLAAISFAGSTNAQKACGTDDVYNRLKSLHPEIAVNEAELEKEIQAKLSNLDLSKFEKTTTTYSDTVTYDIPVVVHVIHDYGTENLSDDSIINAVNYYSMIYQCQNADTSDVIAPFKKYVGNAHVRLHLATIDPSGKPTRGITRHQSYLTINGGDQAKMDDWPQNEYVNIWFINTFSGAHTGAAAYAYYPSSGASMPYYDGIIGLASYLNYDKAIPHEFGHVFNLEHLWGNTNNPDVACGDDAVDDTPPTKGHNPVGCVASALYDTTCSFNYFKKYKSVGGLDSIVNYPDTNNAQNIMEYTYCQKMFTIGQVKRMRAALTSTTAGRNNLWSASNLTATGALAPRPDLKPIADFSVERGTGGLRPFDRSFFLCANSTTSFAFANHSWNDTITNVLWQFSNGPASNNINSMGTVSNSFSQPGWVTVTLIATGNNTGDDTLVRAKAVYVADTNSIAPSGYVQNFVDSASTSNWPMFNYYNNNFLWQLYTGAGYGDGSCVRFRSYDARTAPANYTGNPIGDYDDLISPAFDLTGLGSTVNLNFYTSGATRPNSYSVANDSLDIYANTTCGSRWFKIATLTGSSLSNNSIQSTEFVPTSNSQWQAQTITIPSGYISNRTFIKFRYRSGDNGNNLYLDKFSISPFSTEVNEVIAEKSKLSIFPNPASSNCKVVFMTGADGIVSYSVKDITGKTVFSQNSKYTPSTLVQQELERNIFPTAGMYFVTVQMTDGVYTQKLIIE